MPANLTAAVVIIGNEILSGRTQDSNLTFLGKRLDELGIPLLEARVIPDDEKVIVETVNACRRTFSYVFTTGGIGPTHDDITSASIATAFGVDLERNNEALACLEAYYDSGNINDARMKMANIPKGASLIKNPVSGAPGFQLGNVFVLPGVPMILQAMFDSMTYRLIGGDPILTNSLATNLREGEIAGGLGRLQEKYTDVSIGSYPYFRHGRLGVNIVSRSTSRGSLEALQSELRAVIEECGGKIIASPDS